VLVDTAVRQETETDRVERIFAEAEEVGIDLVRLGDLGQVEVRLPVNRRFRRPPSNAGRTRERARPDDPQNDGYDAASVQTLSFSLRGLATDPLSPADMAFANSASTLAPSPLKRFLKPAVWIVFATVFLSTERSAIT